MNYKRSKEVLANQNLADFIIKWVLVKWNQREFLWNSKTNAVFILFQDNHIGNMQNDSFKWMKPHIHNI